MAEPQEAAKRAPQPAESEIVRRRVVVHGRVQGVGFRQAVESRASSLGLAGWVRNRGDGTVEAVFEGPRDDVDRLVKYTRDGPRGASVDHVDVTDEPPEGLPPGFGAVSFADPARAVPQPVPRSFLAGFSADATHGADALGITERVDFLASALTSKQLETPLAVGLFGDWGSGKSFFMRRLQERIAMLAESSAYAEEAGEPTYYCSHVRQVSFNAWLYADSDIWPSLAARVFRSVSGEETAAPHGELQERHLRDYQRQAAAQAERRAEAVQQAAAYDERIATLTSEIAGKRAAITEIGVELGGEGATAARGIGLVRELGARVARIARGWRRLRPLDVLLLLVPLAVAAGAFIAGSELVALVVAALSPIVPVIVKVVRYVDDTMQLQDEVVELERKRTALEQERDALQQPAVALPTPLLPEYAAEQAKRWAGRERLGVVTEIRMEFEDLSARISGAAADGERLPIDRIIVYIDDLDRCSHNVVVSVLESIKVLLDLPHFIVVVGVDSRWLFRAIQRHFSELLRSDVPGSADDAWAATPQNYLEKIFQYSLVLRPLEAEGYARLLRSLLETEPVAAVEPTEPVAGAPAPVVTVAAAAPDVDLTPDELHVTQEELEFATKLAPLFSTPRAAKRLANVYRLVRVSIGAERLLAERSYEPVLVLLAIAIAFPALAGDLLATIARNGGARWRDLVDGLLPVGEARSNWTGALSDAEAAAWSRLVAALEDVDHPGLRARPLTDFAEWLDVASDFSLHPWQELLAPETRG